MNIQVIGIDHIYIAVSNIRRSEAYYDKVMPILGFRKNQFVNDPDGIRLEITNYREERRRRYAEW